MDQGTITLQSPAAPEVLIFLKGLLAVPFVLHSQPTAVFEENAQTVHQQASVAQRRYAEIMRDVEEIINDHSMFHTPQRCLLCL